MNIISELIKRLENDRALARVRLSAHASPPILADNAIYEDWLMKVSHERAIISQCSTTLFDIKELTQTERSI